MIIKTEKTIPASEITDPSVFKMRRQIIKAALASAAVGVGAAFAEESISSASSRNTRRLPEALIATPAKLSKNYTNYYEFTTNKEDATQLAQNLRTEPWSLDIGGAVEKPGLYALNDVLRQHTLQEYVYRFRCVEGWSMVVPWLGFSLGSLLKAARPLSSAKFVKFTAIYQPDTLPGQRNNALLQWPYVEGLRMDEAMHPLTILAAGMYGDTLPNQNGAPLRLVVPWKYGFKSIKAIVAITLLETPPVTSWNQAAPGEYGFYANVNPAVPHPRWSQSSERQLGSGFFTPRRETQLFNGYAEQVASLYSGMDLRNFF